MLRKWGPLVLVVFAVCYYGQYYRSGLNLGGEGGTVAVNAIRLNEGWLPIKDTTLNYNVLWFYPVAWLFKITGPDYIALRIYFFALCLAAGLMGFLIVRRVTGLGWYALGAGLLIVAIPGMQFRNYVGLLPLLNAWVLLHAFVLAPRPGMRKWLWFACAGLVLGLTFLVRIEEGMFFSAIYFGLVALYPMGVRGEFLKRATTAIGGGILCAAVAVAIHLPFYADAKIRDFGPEFIGQYSTIWHQIIYEIDRRIPGGHASAESFAPPVVSAPAMQGEWIPVRFKGAPKNWAEKVIAEREKHDGMDRGGRPRQELRDLFHQASVYDGIFILILHLPILVSAIVIAAAGSVLAWAIIRANAKAKESALVCLVTLGSALTLFSQYFFFRPDTPHLSEFMIPFMIAMACASFYAMQVAVGFCSWIVRLGCVGFVALCVISEGLFVFHSFQKESAGTIAAARKRSSEVVAENGVRVLLKERERDRIQAIHDLIMDNSQPGEWVVTFPYSPTINFMTNRPSYLKNLYVDNASAGRNFKEEMINDLRENNPAVIVIDQRDINDTEISRFKNWAAPVYEWIRQHYTRVGADLDLDGNEIYVRPGKLQPQA
ncbi:MAG: hypothetical protein ACREKL_16700 [Chthoniobacterales bacterium]